MKENVSLETASTQPNCIRNSCAVSTSIFIFSFLLNSLSLITFIFSWMKWRKARMYRLSTPTTFVSPSTQEYVRQAENTPQSKKLRSPKSSEIVCVHVNDGTLEVQAILPDEFDPPTSSHSDVVLSEIEHLNEVQPRDPDNCDIHATLANFQARQKPKIIIENQLNNDVFLQITPFA
ncbi:unnamed protein product [Dibothriocephalus latus]|uniref:Uncharacterized protein n=1 Tax=Dibothriocephalus latus TaxID=60516 RepID=A0A3P6T8X4_DIBLA|nr:unnamed protein product [Dibothriocephalus latus]